jgi:hypothetical protein
VAERAVSEVIGFVLIFSLILLMTGVIYTGGAAELREVRDDQQVAGVERAFVAVDSDVADLVRDGAPSRSSTIRLNDGALGFEEEVWVNVTVDGDRANGTNSSVRPLVYRLDGEPRLAYAAGMTTRSGGDGGWAVVEGPPIAISGESEPYDAVLFPLVDTDGSGRVEGARSLTVATELNRGDIETGQRRTGDPLSVTVNVTDSPRAGAWERYLAAELDADCESAVGAEEASCTFETDAVRSPAFPVDVRLS